MLTILLWMCTWFWSHLSKIMHLFFILYLLFEDVDFLFFFCSPPLTQYFLECGSFAKETKNSSVCKHYSLLVDELWSRKRYYYLVHVNSEYCRKWNADILFNFELTHQVDKVGDNCWNWRLMYRSFCVCFMTALCNKHFTLFRPRYVVPSQLLRSVRQINSQFRGYGQQVRSVFLKN